MSALLEPLSVTPSKPLGSQSLRRFFMGHSSCHLDLSDPHAALVTPVDINRSRFKPISNRIPRASAREGLIRIEETKGGVVVTGTSYPHVLKSRSIDEGFNAGMDESCSSVPTHVRRGTAKDVEAHKGRRRYKLGNGEI